jgi:hypothetical protein
MSALFVLVPEIDNGTLLRKSESSFRQSIRAMCTRHFAIGVIALKTEDLDPTS